MSVSVAVDGGVARLTLNRPEKLNALDLDLLAAIPDAARRCAEPDVRVAVVRGAGRAFSAGFDIAEFGRAGFGSAGNAGAQLGLAAVEALERIPVVTIAAIDGACIGGGFLLAAACDLRVATTGAIFAIPEIDLGIPLGWGGIPRLVRELGPAVTTELVVTGRRFDAREAVAWRFVNRVVEPGELAAAVGELAATIATKPAAAARTTKQQVRIAADHMVPTHHSDADAVLLAAAANDPESRAAARAYREGLERRRPR